jgi:hypothetical protein
VGGTSRISGEADVQFCEGLGVKFPQHTRRVFKRATFSSYVVTPVPRNVWQQVKGRAAFLVAPSKCAPADRGSARA